MSKTSSMVISLLEQGYTIDEITTGQVELSNVKVGNISA